MTTGEISKAEEGIYPKSENSQIVVVLPFYVLLINST